MRKWYWGKEEMEKQKFYITCTHGKNIVVMQREGEILEYTAPNGTILQIGVAKDDTYGVYSLTEISTGCLIPVKCYKYKKLVLKQLTPNLLTKIAQSLELERNKKVASVLKKYKERQEK